jgi:uncharacterized membrane protein
MIWLVGGILLQGQMSSFRGWRIFMMIVSMILFWGLIIGGIVLLVRFIFPSLDGKSPTNALETLKARYTKGKLPKNSLNR